MLLFLLLERLLVLFQLGLLVLELVRVRLLLVLVLL
jgi:hypothetical protein